MTKNRLDPPEVDNGIRTLGKDDEKENKKTFFNPNDQSLADVDMEAGEDFEVPTCGARIREVLAKQNKEKGK